MKCSKCRRRAQFRTPDGKAYLCEDDAIKFLKNLKNPPFLPRIKS